MDWQEMKTTLEEVTGDKVLATKHAAAITAVAYATLVKVAVEKPKAVMPVELQRAYERLVDAHSELSMLHAREFER